MVEQELSISEKIKVFNTDDFGHRKFSKHYKQGTVVNESSQPANRAERAVMKDYLLLIKPSLSIMVVFSSIISYLLAPKVVAFDWKMIVLLANTSF